MANFLFGGVNLKTLGFHNGIANAKAYGAKADDSYDNTGILQAIVDAWEALDGGTIVLPASQEGARYRVTGPITNDSVNIVNFSGTGSSSKLYTEGGNASVLWLDSDTDNASIIRYACTSHTGGMIIERLTFMGNDDTDGLGSNQSGIVFAGRSSNHKIQSCGFSYISGYALAHDPTVSQVYSQNCSLRDSHFWRVGGCVGPTEEYVAASAFYFCTLYEMSNIGLDGGLGWTSWGHTAKPFIFDFRASRMVRCAGNFLLEGANTDVVTACCAFMTGTDHSFDVFWQEFSANSPTYLFSVYGRTNAVGVDGQKLITVNSLTSNPSPIWFEDDATNESVVKIGHIRGYNYDTIADVVEFENGVDANTCGSVEIGYLESKYPVRVPDNYYGRVSIGASGADQPSRAIKQQKARRLLSWNPSMGSMVKSWGETHVYIINSATSVIEADGAELICEKFTGTATTFPNIYFRVFGDNYEGAVVTIIIRHRATIDPADASGFGRLNTSGLTEGEFINADALSNGIFGTSTTYQTIIGSAYIQSDVSDPNRQFTIAGSGTFTVAPIWRVISLEMWLGTPDVYDLATAGVPIVPTFTASDTTPSVAGYKTWKTHTAGLTLTDLDDFPAGEERTIISKGAIVFDTTGTNLVGSSVDIATASGDVTKWVSEDGTTKRLVSFIDVSDDNSIDNP